MRAKNPVLNTYRYCCVSFGTKLDESDFGFNRGTIVGRAKHLRNNGLLLFWLFACARNFAFAFAFTFAFTFSFGFGLAFVDIFGLFFFFRATRSCVGNFVLAYVSHGGWAAGCVLRHRAGMLDSRLTRRSYAALRTDGQLVPVGIACRAKACWSVGPALRLSYAVERTD